MASGVIFLVTVGISIFKLTRGRNDELASREAVQYSSMPKIDAEKDKEESEMITYDR